MSKEKKTNAIIIVLSVLLLLLFLCFAFWPGCLMGYRAGIEGRCSEILSALAREEKTYLRKYEEYGSFEDLVRCERIPSSLTRESLIRKYTIVEFTVTPAVYDNEELVEKAQFVIIAIPSKLNDKLRIRAINESNRIHDWIGEEMDWSDEIFDLSDSTKWRKWDESDWTYTLIEILDRADRSY